MDVTAPMAAEHLADAAVVITPAHGRELLIVKGPHGESPTRSRVA
ncbi:hypothetical protein [Streptomyces sp. NPDC058623]